MAKPVTKIARILAAAATAFGNLPEYAERIEGASYASGLATAGSVVKWTSLTPVAKTAPTSTANIGFLGTPTAPTTALTLKTAPVAGTMILVEYVPLGGQA